MDSLKKIYIFIILIAISLVLSACATRHFASIKNDTETKIKVKSFFENKSGSYVLESQIKKGENNIWLYEKPYLDDARIDSKLKVVEATNNKGCTVTFNRAAIDKKVEHHELEVVIEPQDFIDACGEKVAK